MAAPDAIRSAILLSAIHALDAGATRIYYGDMAHRLLARYGGAMTRLFQPPRAARVAPRIYS